MDPQYHQTLQVNSINSNIPLIHEIVHANKTSPSLEMYRDKARHDDPKCQIRDDLLTFENRPEVAKDDETLITRLMQEIHDQKSTAHPGQCKTLKVMYDRYHWPGWRSDVIRDVKSCAVCQRLRNPRHIIPGLLQSLSISNRPWQHISMDFISLPKDCNGFDSAFVTVNRLSEKTVSILCHITDGKNVH